MTRWWGPRKAAPGLWHIALWAPGQDGVTLEIEGQEPVSSIGRAGSSNSSPVAPAQAGAPLVLQNATPDPKKRDPRLRGDDEDLAANGFVTFKAPAQPGTRYRFRLADGTVVPDPASRSQSGGVHGWSVLVEPEAYPWKHADWRGRPWHEAIVQELHVGTLGGFRGVAQELERIAALGITAVELMPINAFSGTRNWGYDGVLPFAPAESYGTPDDLRALVDTAHGLGLMVFLDVVYNHFGPDGNYLGAYAPGFFHTDVDTPWGGAVAVDEPAVAAFFRENALMWLTDYRFDGLRFDAVHAIGNPAFLDTLAQDIREALPGRHVHLVLENEHNDAQRLAPDLYDAQWNDDFHNVLHVLLTGETDAYYADFADHPAERLARCLAEGFIYQGEPSANQDGKYRGSLSGHLPPTSFVAFLQNHDQVGNRAMGERLTLLTCPDKLRAATALLLLCPQIPLLFMGDESGSEAPFLFFTDFHDELADAVREGRRKEFAKFAAFADEAARARIPDPNAESTFTASQPRPGPNASEWEALYRELIALRTQQIVPRLVGTRAIGAQTIGPAAVMASWALGDGAVLTIAIDLADEAGDLPEAAGEVIHAEGRRFIARLAPA
ncbi:maltooligosyltrehalose trehalohydrolase [Novosphingobium chloroacetimidivorans]|uniref:Malto-oligosyltrehalose trehalohydrolase n=1 Tax=Novosphingobium chloroacetimidivorans TaxID=1428314 RepID=A0A7W7K8X2_9SPHN|nr:malto-oligosyltrehalose trehalohydrolase [Novosphingobium chloroacetimidivorans]MBB4857688.1 maltooligosyltrehalose trehalohydrolase [Novosphingobium chloroacetimidivorans]